jgi:DNA-directed RNA polymerase subunit RPC12/RpoP
VPQYDSYNSLLRDDESYRDQWRLYYAERQRVMRRLVRFATGAVILILLFAILPSTIQLHHVLLMNTLGGVGALLLLATGTQWFIFNWSLGGWTCPRCGEPFFRSTFVRNPFGMRCRHCNLKRLKKSEAAAISLT